MQGISRFLVAVLVASVAACGGPDEMDDLGTSESGLSRRLDTGRIIVKWKSGVTDSTKANAHATNGGSRRKVLKNGAHVVNVSKASTRSILARYKANPNVLAAEIDALVPHDHTGLVVPNDPIEQSQFQHDAIDAPGAWSLGTGSTSINLAVCDTGVSATHPDLKARLRTDLCWNTAYGTAGDCDPVDWHGTGVAGAAAAIGNNNIGMAGTAWAASIIPVRVSNELDGSAYISDMADCLTYAADKGAHVINLSYQTYDAGTIYQTILDAATYAESKGALVVVASGNEGVNAVPSQDPTQIVFVGATGSGTKTIATFSNYGAYVDLAAPGEDVVVTGLNVTCTDANANGVADRGECTKSGDGYFFASGTSFAAPIVAGAAVVLKALKPTATPADLRTALYNTAQDLGVAGSDAYYGFGLVNLHQAAHKLLGTTTTANAAPVIRILSPTAGAVGTVGMPNIVEASATDAEDGDLGASIRWNFGDGQTATGAVWGAHAYSAAGTYTVTATVTDRGGLTSSASIAFTVAAPIVNSAPTLTVSAPTTSTVNVLQGTTIAFRATANDAQDGDLTSAIVWSVPNGSVNGGSWSMPFNTLGAFTITARVSDRAGATAAKTITVNVTSAGTVSAPTSLTITSPARRQVALRWTDTATNETGFYVERAAVYTNGVGTWYRRATLGANVTSFTEAVAKGTWAYRVRAYNASGDAVSGAVQIVIR